MEAEFTALLRHAQEMVSSPLAQAYLGLGTLVLTILLVMILIGGVRSKPIAGRSRASWLLIIGFALIGIGISAYVGIGTGPVSPILDALARASALLSFLGLGFLLIGIIIVVVEAIAPAARQRNGRSRR